MQSLSDKLETLEMAYGSEIYKELVTLTVLNGTTIADEVDYMLTDLEETMTVSYHDDLGMDFPVPELDRENL